MEKLSEAEETCPPQFCPASWTIFVEDYDVEQKIESDCPSHGRNLLRIHKGNAHDLNKHRKNDRNGKLVALLKSGLRNFDDEIVILITQKNFIVSWTTLSAHKEA